MCGVWQKCERQTKNGNGSVAVVVVQPARWWVVTQSAVGVSKAANRPTSRGVGCVRHVYVGPREGVNGIVANRSVVVIAAVAGMCGRGAGWGGVVWGNPSGVLPNQTSRSGMSGGGNRNHRPT